MRVRKLAPTSSPAIPQIVATKARVKVRCEKATFSLDASAAEGRFLIFAEGKIKTDYGISVMTPEAGANVIRVFRERGNDMPIDLRHGMLSEKPTLEESLAYGWIPCPDGLEYIKGKGLYAKSVQWDPRVKAALQAKPPQIKYHSPAYDQDPKTGVIISLDNVAITNLPATHNLRRMAAEKRKMGMDLDLAKAGQALMALMQLVNVSEGDALSAAQAALDALKEALGDQVDAAIDAAQGPESEPVVAPGEDDSFLAEMPEDDRKAYEGLSDAMKAAVKAGLKASATPEVQAEAPKVEAEKSEEPAVKAETPKDEKVAAEKSKAPSLSAQDLENMHAGMEAKAGKSREEVVREAIANNKILASMGPKLLDRVLVSDEAFATFMAKRKTVTKVVASTPVTTRIPIKPDAPKTKVGVAAEREIAKMAPAFGVDPAEVAQVYKKNFG